MHLQLFEKVGESYRDFVVTKIFPLSELRATLIELIHEPTDAQVMHIQTEDPENLFCLSFKTYPSCANGAPHILEHTVLCGSKRFPIKDPFFAMTRRSLNTFMNALTGADFTCYPAASQVEKDFYNLLDVYLDAVFHPQLKLLSFLQEGHRLEFADPQDPKTPLEIKGIVYNEMKGSLTSADARLWKKMMQELCPDLPYAFNSGGDPQDIPTLSYEELIAFHEKYYHPSRCLFFFYGNLPLKGHLDFICEKALKNVSKVLPHPPIGKQKRFTTPVLKESSYPISEGEDLHKKTMIAFGWLTSSLSDQKTVLALSVLDSILMDTDASLLKKALLQSGLCIQAAGAIDVEMSEVPYLIVCKGCEKENVERLESLLFSTLEEIIEKGIPLPLIESAIHQLEFSRTEIVGDHCPFGLTLFMRSALAKQHQCPPENALIIHALFEELLKEVKNPTYLTGILKKQLRDNPHCVRLILSPDPQLAQQEIKEEKERIATIREGLSKQEIEKLLLQAEALQRYQVETEHQSLACLPQVFIEDVPVTARAFSLQETSFKNLKIFHHDCFTNHIVYADLLFDLPEISVEELPLLQLMIALITEVGVGKRDYVANLEYIHAYTGGISAASALYVQTVDPKAMRPCLTLRGKALSRNTHHLFSLLKEMATLLRFDESKRIEELILQLFTGMQQRLNRNALRYAIQLSLSGFSLPSHISELGAGLTYYHTIKDLAHNLPARLPRLIDTFIALKERIFCSKEPHLVLTCDGENLDLIQKSAYFGLGELPQKNTAPWKADYPLKTVESQARPIASPVAFTCKSYKTIAYLHPHAPALSVAAHIMDNTTLHLKVREQGGAYGVGAHFGPMLGHFYLHAYRDPHIAHTLSAFDEAIDVVARGDFEERDVQEAKLGMIQQLDAPVAPGSRGLTAYNWLREGKTPAMRQSFRDRLLELTTTDIKQAVETELLPKKQQGVVVTLAGQSLIDKENEILAEEHKALSVVQI